MILMRSTMRKMILLLKKIQRVYLVIFYSLSVFTLSCFIHLESPNESQSLFSQFSQVTAKTPQDPFAPYDPYATQVNQTPSALSPLKPVTLKGEQADWQSRAQQWYESSDPKQRRVQMRSMSKPLKRSCYYCHTKNFKGYTEAQYLISLQMMAISAEQGVTCEECHLGRRGLTELGAKSLIQWRYAHEKNLDCRDCHQPQGRFRKLTSQGKEARSNLIKESSIRAKKWGIADELITQWIKQLQSDTVTSTLVSPPSSLPHVSPQLKIKRE